ncbi:MAG TPA: hypothetical protein DDY70_06720, partial [Clostridiales bacterium]|nr:hypothetical protein [Clostridiales bacterium]
MKRSLREKMKVQSFSERSAFYMKAKRWHKVLFGIGITLLSLCLLFVLGIGALMLYAERHLDAAGDELLFRAARCGSVTRFYVDGGEGGGDLSSYVPTEYRSLSLGADEKFWYSYDEISENIKNAFLAAEDRKFFSHPGFDAVRTARAALNQVTHTGATYGASTITQQVVKNISGDREVTFTRKLSEILRAVHLEHKYTKEEIFEVYLNIVPMGDRLIGVGAASRDYFGKEPSELSLAEAATLVGITNAPSRYHPRLHPEASLEKRNRVLYAMLDFGVIDESVYRAACEEPLVVRAARSKEDSVRSWFIETVLDDVTHDLEEKLGMKRETLETLLMSGGLSVYTTMRPEVQSALEETFDTLAGVPEGLHYAMVVVDTQSNTLAGIVGNAGKKEGNRLLNFATVPHTPGSVLKPLALYAPLLNEKRINAATVFDDVPVAFSEREGVYTEYPHNSPNVYDGLTPVCEGLRLSKNTLAARLYEMRGAEAIYRTLYRDFGFDTLVRSRETAGGGRLTDLALAPLALGQLTDGVTLRRLTEAYSVFPSDGIMRRGRSYLAVYDGDGNLIYENPGEEKEVFSPSCARIMNQMLSRVVESGTAKGIRLADSVDTAGKTGTSGESRDRLFVGYTPYYTAGIWCGYSFGGKSVPREAPSHLAVWDSAMEKIHRARLSDVPEEKTLRFSTEGLVRREFCMDSG